MARFFGIQFGSRFVSTKKYESFLNREKNDFERFVAFESSELLKRYNYLDSLVHSGEFKKKVHELKHGKYKDTPQWRQLDQFNAIASAPDIKSYLKFKKSGKLERLTELESSPEIREFKELEKFINSPAFHAAKVAKDYKQSESFVKESRYKALHKEPEIKFYHETSKSAEYKNILKLEGSERLKSFFELEAITTSDEFLEHKAFMEDKKRFKKSEEARLIAEHELLGNNKEIAWYLERKNKDTFRETRKWELAFEDDFDGYKLDKERWMTGYYWGKAFMDETYALAGENQIFRDDNIEISDSIAKIITRKESARGKVWEPVHGFTLHHFDYTSGLISTGQSFRQKHGKFIAKVKFSKGFPLLNAFWMVGEKMSPQIDIFKTSNSKGRGLECGIHYTANNGELQHLPKKVNGTRFSKKFFIYTLEWDEDFISWKINDVEVHREVKNIPQEMMYLVFCTILPGVPADSDLPTQMEIDWIRCYSRKKE